MADFTEEEKKVQYFPEGSLLNTMIISIIDSEKRFTDILKEPYTVYLIETKYIDGGPPAGEPDMSSSIWRRYSEFELLRNYLVANFPALIVPPLPEKRINIAALRIAADKFDPDFIEKRKVALESFLLRCAAHPQLSQDLSFVSFFNQEEGWKETLLATNFQSKVDSRLKSWSASAKEPDRRFEDMKHYAENLGSNVAAMIKVRQRISDTIFSIHKQHATYGKIFSEWSSLEKEMGDDLQKSGHYMDRFAASVDEALVEDEMAFSEPLKEYLHFSDVLKGVASRQLLRQYDMEKAEETLTNKKTQRDELNTQKEALQSGHTPPKSGGFSFKGLSSMIFGAETPEVLETKINNLDEQINDAEENVKTTKEEVRIFNEEALKDYEHFKKQEVRDLKEVLAAHIKTQIMICKLGMSTWQDMKDTANTL
ncbi:sorting nexin-4-like isoform X1 [Stylophora pistillata]|uniref:Sorting nexin-4 n=2 Tax=Stylophora pistillata TaxID=50429 RepID=A0A2B4SXB5_STYPI|nr:sorting nexin-4-like isoform X1 [Stylophora pistillata]PFX33178.1 Sorting nexin-4 [Stylophora pistillata]